MMTIELKSGEKERIIELLASAGIALDADASTDHVLDALARHYKATAFA